MVPKLLLKIRKAAAQISPRPAGVWDFIIRPDTTAESSEDIKKFEQLWAEAERAAYAAGELDDRSAAAS